MEKELEKKVEVDREVYEILPQNKRTYEYDSFANKHYYEIIENGKRRNN